MQSFRVYWDATVNPNGFWTSTKARVFGVTNHGVLVTARDALHAVEKLASSCGYHESYLTTDPARARLT